MVLWRHSECLLRSVWRLLTVAIAEMVMRMSATVLGFVFGGVAKRRKAEEVVVSVVSTLHTNRGLVHFYDIVVETAGRHGRGSAILWTASSCWV